MGRARAARASGGPDRSARVRVDIGPVPGPAASVPAAARVDIGPVPGPAASVPAAAQDRVGQTTALPTVGRTPRGHSGGPGSPRRRGRHGLSEKRELPGAGSRPRYEQRPRDREGGPDRGFRPRPGERAGPHDGSGERPRPRRAGLGFGRGDSDDAAPPRPPRPDVRDEGVEVPPTEAEEAMPGPGFDAASGGQSERTVERNLSTPRPTPRPDYRRRAGGYPDRPQNRPSGPAPARWQRSTVGSPSSELLGEDEELVAGRHPVEEAFIAHRKALRLLVVPQRRQALEKLVLHATNLRIPIVEIEGGTLTSLAGFDGHQGIALVTDRRQFASLDDILARAIERHEAPFVLVLDLLEDPQNFGSLLRTAEASGVHGVIYPTHRQAPLSAAAIKASAGAVEHLLLLPVEDLAEALTDLHIRGLRIVGTDAEAPLTVRQADLRGPAAIVVGSEGQGLGPAVRRRCDTVVRIPMRGRVTSLNASVAGSILLYEASSQRGGERTLIAPATDQEPPPGFRAGGRAWHGSGARCGHGTRRRTRGIGASGRTSIGAASPRERSDEPRNAGGATGPKARAGSRRGAVAGRSDG